MRSVAIVLGSVLLAGGVSVAAAQAAQPTLAEKKSATTVMLPPAPKKLLPEALDGWVQTAPPKITTDPAQFDPANAAALKEYGLVSAQIALYTRDDETLKIRALSFDDLTGAYGAYSYYRQNGWPKEDIGAGATSDHNRVLFWKGTTVVDANFSHITPESAEEMRSIAAKLPMPAGSKAVPPPVLSLLPKASLDGQTTHYALGPASYAGSGGVLPPSIVGFDLDAETATANYSLTSGPATLTIIEYPTPQIADEKETQIRAYIQAGSKAAPPWPKPLTDSDTASLEVRKSGVLVILVSGDAIPDDSHRLIETVHYEAQLMSVPQPMQSEVSKTSQLLMGIASIVIVGSLAAILLGFFLGGGRALYRIAHGKPASAVYDEEFIRIDLREEPDEFRGQTRPPDDQTRTRE